MRLALLAALALAAPERPEPQPPRPLDCPRAYDVADPCEATCVPRADVLDWLALEDYAAELEAHVRALEHEVRAAELKRDAARSEADRWREEATRPPPLLQRPGVGVVAGAGLCALSGWAVGQAGR